MRKMRILHIEKMLFRTSGVTSYGGSGKTISIPRTPAKSTAVEADTSWPTKPDGLPDFASMTPPQRLAYHQARLAGTIQ